MERQGARLSEAVNAAAADAGLAEYVAAVSPSSCLVFTTRDRSGTPSQEYRTLFLRELLRQGVLPAVADASQAKQGRRMPGTDIPVIGPEEMIARRPNLVLLLLPDLLGEVRTDLSDIETMVAVGPRSTT